MAVATAMPRGAGGWLTRLLGRRANPSPALSRLRPVPPAAPVEITWSFILHRCREVTEADAVFAVDGEGLVLAQDGDIDEVETARVAAHVSRAFDLLDALERLGPSTEALCARYTSNRWLTAVRIRPTADAVVTILVIGPYTLVERGRQRLRNTFLRLFDAA